jgi:hypothetical protein
LDAGFDQVQVKRHKATTTNRRGAAAAALQASKDKKREEKNAKKVELRQRVNMLRAAAAPEPAIRKRNAVADGVSGIAPASR